MFVRRELTVVDRGFDLGHFLLERRVRKVSSGTPKTDPRSCN